MFRTRRIVLTLIVCLCAAVSARAQAPAPDGWVVLPVDEYRALRARANPDAPAPTPPPIDATLTRIDYDLRVDPSASIGGGSDIVAGRALLTIDVLRDGWVKVPIPAGLMVRDARIDASTSLGAGGQPVALLEGPPAHVVLSRPGRSVLALDITLPMSVSAGAESIALPASAAALSRAVLTVPRGGVDLTVTGGVVSDRSESASESKWTALGRANQPLGFSWKRKSDDRRAELPLRYRARIASAVGLGEEVSSVSATVRVEIQQGVAREVTLSLPTNVIVNQVNGATVADWDLKAGLLRVRLLDPVSTELSFIIQGEARLPADGDIAVPLVRAPAAERETGGIAISVLGAGEIEKHQIRGLDLADVSELSDVVAGRESPSMVAFRLRPSSGADARSLNVSVKRYTPQAVLIANIEEARYRALAAEDGVLLVEARYAVRNNQRSFLKVTLPEGAAIWSASVAGKAVRPGIADTRSVLLALEKGRAGEDAPTFVVRLTYLQPIDVWTGKGHAHLQLPAVDLPISRTGVELYHSPRYRMELQPGAFRVEQDPGVFAEALRAYAIPPRPPSPMAPRAAPAPPPPVALREAPQTQGGLKTLIDRYRDEGGGRIVRGSLPVDVTFPSIGPSLFVASELTPESQSPSIDFAIRRTK